MKTGLLYGLCCLSICQIYVLYQCVTRWWEMVLDRIFPDSAVTMKIWSGVELVLYQSAEEISKCTKSKKKKRKKDWFTYIYLQHWRHIILYSTAGIKSRVVDPCWCTSLNLGSWVRIQISSTKEVYISNPNSSQCLLKSMWNCLKWHPYPKVVKS